MSQRLYGELLQRDLAAAMRVYWLEILYRAHFAAATSLVRTKRWLDGMFDSALAPNYTAFMASFRGFLEAASDTFHTFQDVPMSLAECHTIIRRAIKGDLKRLALAPDLEKTLIHFTYGRRIEKGEDAPASHRAKTVKEYLESLIAYSDPKIAECYQNLCEVIHPGSLSVICYARIAPTDGGTLYCLEIASDRELITSFCMSYVRVMLEIVSLALSPPLFVLRILNEFQVPELRTESVMTVDIENRPLWAEIVARLNDPSPPTTRAVEKQDFSA